MDPSRIYDEFPAPSFRGNQKQALEDIRAAFEAGNDVVLVRAPTGSGKSLLARAIAGCARRVDDADADDPIDAYYTTPQVSQLDDVESDDLLSDFSLIRGKNNYNCILPGEQDTPVTQAPCARESDYGCSMKHRCPYFTDRVTAANQRIAATTLAYFMQTARGDTFGERDVVVIDEAHGLSDWAEMYATITLSPAEVPVWGELSIPQIRSVDDALEFSRRVLLKVERRLKELRGKVELNPEEAAERDKLDALRRDLRYFESDYESTDSATTWIVDQDSDEISIRPMNPERYLKHTVWERGNKLALLSATILNKDAFCRGVGLNPDDVALVTVPHTFPVENRPLYDVTVGKMTYEHREETVPKLARLISRLMAKHPDEKGLIHCHSYAIQSKLERLLSQDGVDERIRSHNRKNRDAALERWKDQRTPEVFLSVKMEEALDLEGDLCRWQVICKAPYPNTRDSRVAERLENDQWGWYYRTTLRTVIQACGRVVRSPEDYGATYLADSSLLDLFERAKRDMPEWFQEQVARMSIPSIPEHQPGRAVSNVEHVTTNRS